MFETSFFHQKRQVLEKLEPKEIMIYVEDLMNVVK